MIKKRKYGLSATLLATAIMVVILSGCGIKPNSLDPPKPDKFPNTYPAPEQNRQ